MSDTDKTNGPKRWYDPYKVTMILFSIVGLFLLTWGGFVFTLAYGATTANVHQDEQIKALQGGIERIEKWQEREGVKTDRILEHLPK